MPKVGADIALLGSSNCPCAFGHAARYLDMVNVDWLSQKLNEILEFGAESQMGSWLQQRSNRVDIAVVMCSDAGLMWADPRHAELAVAELGRHTASTDEPRRKSNAPSDHEKWSLMCHSQSQRVSKTGIPRNGQTYIAFACEESSRAVGKATRTDLRRQERVGRHLLHTPCTLR